jgi:acyl-CoA synthetase (NDP forming)
LHPDGVEVFKDMSGRSPWQRLPMTDRQETFRSIKAILNARSVAVVGASGDPHKLGYMTFDSIIKGGFEGRLYPVNPKAGIILGHKAYSSLGEVPDRVDVVVIIVPARLVPGVLEEAAAKGAKGAIIQSAGFRESGRAELEKEVLELSRKCEIRLMGPNIQGINYLPNKFCAMFFPVIKRRGPIAIVSQSGSVTAALSEWADRDGLGISAAINLGNQTDICEADYLEFFSEDRNTKAIVMYLEGLKDAQRFLQALEERSDQKPIVILKSGRTISGARSAASHTGSLAGSHDIFCEVCRQYGIFPVHDLVSLYDSAKGFACIEPPEGNRVIIISTSGGAATLAADEAESLGLTLPDLPAELKTALKQMSLSPLANLSNPLDLAGIQADHFLQSARMVDRYNIADSILINFADPVKGAPEVIRTLISELKARLAVSYMGGGEEEKNGSLEIQSTGVSVFPSPERAVRGVAATVWRTEYQRTHPQATGKKDD